MRNSYLSLKGISKAYGGVLSALEIIYSLHGHDEHDASRHADPLQVKFAGDGSTRKRFREVEEVTALYPEGRKVVLDRRTGIVAF